MKIGLFGKARSLEWLVSVSLVLLLALEGSGGRPVLGQASKGMREDDLESRAELPQSSTTLYLPFVSRYYDKRVPPFGIQFYGSHRDDTFAYAENAGARWIRVPVSWASAEPVDATPKQYRWSTVDSWVANATQAGIHLVLTLEGHPSWATEYVQGVVTDTTDLEEFVVALVERYDGDGLDDAPGSPQVHNFEFYNEPDNFFPWAGGDMWGRWGDDGEFYAHLLQTLHPLVKAADPDANLVFGGIALDWFDDSEPPGPFGHEFLDDVLAECEGQDCFDVMNFHYYTLFRPTWEEYGPDIIGKTNYVRGKLAQYGFEDTPVICTEAGLAGGGGVGDDELQSRYVCKGYVRAMAAGLGTVVWYMISDATDGFLPGLLNSDLDPKPSYDAYQTMTEMLGPAQYQYVVTSTIAITTTALTYDYVFRRLGRRLDVVWTEDEIAPPYDPDDDPSVPFTVTAGSLRVVDKFGIETWLNDEDDGSADGRITVTVGGSPIYLEYYP